MSGMSRFSLILFDDDGCTAVVETKKLKGDLPLKPSVICTLGMACGPDYKVEILGMSDYKKELNKFEDSWSKTQRSVALDEAKDRSQKGGYLSIWPQDEVTPKSLRSGNSVSVENSAEERPGSKRRKVVKKTSKKADDASSKPPQISQHDTSDNRTNTILTEYLQQEKIQKEKKVY